MDEDLKSNGVTETPADVSRRAFIKGDHEVDDFRLDEP
jgi:hypothetical protein